ncbi:MAG: hypothetical protein NTV68_02170 [Methanomicrobiales archaeon]|nr:hypothetical protein [Methanomicrobiales archaeon]
MRQLIGLLVVSALIFGLGGCAAGIAVGPSDPNPDFVLPGWIPAQNYEHRAIFVFFNASLVPGENYIPVSNRSFVIDFWKPIGSVRKQNISGDPGITLISWPGGTGYLEGEATIGPLCPVEPCLTTVEQRASAYGARPLIITNEGLSSRIYTVKFSPEGHYRIELPVGRYHVAIANNGIGDNLDEPINVVIKRGKTVTLNFSIDTGIR